MLGADVVAVYVDVLLVGHVELGLLVGKNSNIRGVVLLSHGAVSSRHGGDAVLNLASEVVVALLKLLLLSGLVIDLN